MKRLKQDFEIKGEKLFLQVPGTDPWRLVGANCLIRITYGREHIIIIMNNFKLLQIDDRELIRSFLKVYRPLVSELTFTNLFMWREFYNFSYNIINGFLCIIASPNEGEPYSFMPIGDGSGGLLKKTIGAVGGYFANNGWKPAFRKIVKQELGFFEDFIAGSENIVFDRDNSDYIYDTQDLIQLKGKKFHSKRNHINKFNKMYSYSYERINMDNICFCFEIMEDWCKGRECGCKRGDYCERYANAEVLDNYEALGCRGALIKVDGKYKAFTVGEMLNDDTAVIHIEKASFGINGLYTKINQQFCEYEWNNTKYINREQDLGQPGLRKAKLSYNPVRLERKYNVYL